MRGRKNPLLEIQPVPEGTPLTFDVMARAHLKDYVLQRYRTLNTARPRARDAGVSDTVLRTVGAHPVSDDRRTMVRTLRYLQ